MAKTFLPVPHGIVTKANPKRRFFMPAKYPYKTPDQIQRCAELQSKADKAAIQIKYAANKKMAVRTFLQYLYLSI